MPVSRTKCIGWTASRRRVRRHDQGAAQHVGRARSICAAVLEATVGPLPPEEDEFVRRALKRQDKYIDPRRPARNSDQSFCGIGLSSAQVSAFLPAKSPDHMPNSGLPWWWQTTRTLWTAATPRYSRQTR